MNDKIILGKKIRFAEEKQSYTVVAVSPRFAIAVRQLDMEEDKYLLHLEVKSGGCFTMREAFDSLKEFPIYTIVDKINLWRGPTNQVLNDYDFRSSEGLDRCLDDLAHGIIEISERQGCKLNIV